jgi:ABC-2 type transport system permease protein
MGSVYLLTLGQLFGRWRLLIMTVLASLPVLVAMLVVRSSSAPSVAEFETIVVSGMLAGSIAPLVVLAIATAAFANEIEDRTLANLTLAPIPRWQIVVPKLLAAITIAAPFMVISAFVTSHVAFLADARATAAVTVSVLVGVALYASAFVWLGLVTTQAIGFGLLYIVLWEGFFSGFVSGVRMLSIRHYAIAWMHGLDERRFAAADHLSFGVVIVTSVLVFGGFLWLSVRRLRRMDVP